MEDQLTCHNNHIYESSYENCPYCPGEGVNATVAEGATDNSTSSSEKTEIMDDNKADKTAIHQKEDSQEVPHPSGRKLVGWLVSYTWDANGKDYQLREGKTTIGADSSSDICISDSEVSAHHCTILYRGEKFQIKDEFSTNGLMINNQEIDDKAELQDGDMITLGKTEIKFRSA